MGLFDEKTRGRKSRETVSLILYSHNKTEPDQKGQCSEIG
jgi:hypothetical protein